MIPIVEKRVGELQQLCIRYRILRLDLFGSAATGNHHRGESVVDFLVEFHNAALRRIRRRLLRAAGIFGTALWTPSRSRRRFGYQESLLPATR